MLAMALILAAQVTGNVISGDWPLPGCIVGLSAPQFERYAVSDHEGSYRFLAVPPGTYDLTLELPGMKTVRHAVVVAEERLELPPDEMFVDETIEIYTVTCTLGRGCSDREPASKWDAPSCSEHDENSRLLERGGTAELLARYDTTFTLIERHRIGTFLLGKIADDEAIVRELEEYALLASGTTITPELEAWCLARRLDPEHVLVIALNAQQALASSSHARSRHRAADTLSHATDQ